MIRCSDVPMKGNSMTNQSQPGQQNKAPGQKPGQQQGGGQKPGQQSQAPANGDNSPQEPHDQRSDSDT
jgi:type VI secretion system secreted protein VgrG